MQLKAMSLLLAALSVVNAGVAKRQCYPETITIVATKSAPASVTTVTVTSAAFPAYGGALPTYTTTQFVTNVITLPVTTATVYKTITGLSSGSSSAAPTSNDAPGLSTDANPNNAFAQLSISQPLDKQPLAPTSTRFILSTVLVIPVPSVQQQTGPADNGSSTVTAMPYSALGASATPTVTVDLTSTIYVASTAIASVTPPFPTLNITGTMGLSPSGTAGSGSAGAVGASGASSSALPGTGAFPESLPGTGFLPSTMPDSGLISSSLLGSNVTGTGITVAPPAFPTSTTLGISPGTTPFPNSTTSGGGAGSITGTGLVGTSDLGTSISGTAASTGTLARRCVPPMMRRHKEKRQLGAIVTATIDGVIVTWTNSYDGSELSTGPAVYTPKAISTSTAGPTPMTTASQMTSVATYTGHAFSSSSVLSVASPASTSSDSNDAISTNGPPPYVPPAWLTSEFPYPPSASPLPTSQSVSSVASAVTPANTTSKPSAASTMSAPFTNQTTTTGSAVVPTCSGQFAGTFSITFDDLPRNGEPTTSEQYPPLQNPYRKLSWSQGFSYAPPPNDPFKPHSGSQLGVFIVDGNANVHSQNWTGPIPNGEDVNGMFGAGPYYQDPSFFFDAYSAWLGCQNEGPADCQIQVNGYALDDATGGSVLQVEQYFYQSPCPGLQNCSLQYFEFGEAFRNLSALQIQASQQGDPNQTSLTWYVDDIDLAWSDNTCVAVEERSSAPGITRRDGKKWGTQPVPTKGPIVRRCQDALARRDELVQEENAGVELPSLLVGGKIKEIIRGLGLKGDYSQIGAGDVENKDPSAGTTYSTEADVKEKFGAHDYHIIRHADDDNEVARHNVIFAREIDNQAAEDNVIFARDSDKE